MEQTISNAQIYKLFIIISTATKFLTLPSFYMQAAGRDSWFSVIVNVIMDFFLLLCVLAVLKANGNMTFCKLMEKYFGKIVSRILLLLISAYLIFRSIPFIVENYNILAAVLYEVPNWYALVFPIYIVAGYVAYKGARVMGRVAEIMYFFFLASLVILFLLSLSELTLQEVLPVFEFGVVPPLKAAIKGMTTFGDYGLLLIFMGKTDNLTVKKQISGYGVAAAIVIIFNFLFVMIFGIIGVYQPDAIIRLTQYNTVLTNYGRVDWLIAIIWQISQILYLAVLVYGAAEFVRWVFNIKNRLPVMIGVIAIIEILIRYVFYSVEILNKTYGSTMSYYFLFLQYVLPVILGIISFVKLLKDRRMKKCRIKISGEKQPL